MHRATGMNARLSAAVEKIWDFLVGMTVLRGMSLVKTPPVVSIPVKRPSEPTLEGSGETYRE